MWLHVWQYLQLQFMKFNTLILAQSWIHLVQDWQFFFSFFIIGIPIPRKMVFILKQTPDIGTSAIACGTSFHLFINLN